MKLSAKQKRKLMEIVREGIPDSPHLDFIDWCIERGLTPSDATKLLDGILVFRTAEQIMKPVMEKIKDYEKNAVKA